MFRYVSGAGLRSYRIKSRTDFLEGVRNITHGAKIIEPFIRELKKPYGLGAEYPAL